MLEWEFHNPWFLLVAMTSPIFYWLMKKPDTLLAYSSLTILNQCPKSLRARFADLPTVLLAIAIVTMSIALAGPRRPDRETQIKRDGIAIVMTVDRSGSMNARDLVETDRGLNRLDVVKSLFKQFVLGESTVQTLGKHIGKGRPNDVIGLVTFARYADGMCPLTLDHGNLINIVEDLEIVTDPREDGTSLGEGLALAVERLRRHPAQSKIAILLTDGVNNAGNITPAQAANLASLQDVKVYCIGAGTTGVAPVPATDPFSGRTVFRPMRVDIDEQTLKMIAQKTNGRYFRATDADGLAEIYREIDQLERTEVSEARYAQYHEYYPVFVWAALALIGFGSLLADSFFRRLP